MKTKFEHLKTITKLDNLHLDYYNGGYLLVLIGKNHSVSNAFGMNERLTNKQMSIFIDGLLEMYYFLNK